MGEHPMARAQGEAVAVVVIPAGRRMDRGRGGGAGPIVMAEEVLEACWHYVLNRRREQRVDQVAAVVSRPALAR